MLRTTAWMAAIALMLPAPSLAKNGDLSPFMRRILNGTKARPLIPSQVEKILGGNEPRPIGSMDYWAVERTLLSAAKLIKSSDPLAANSWKFLEQATTRVFGERWRTGNRGRSKETGWVDEQDLLRAISRAGSNPSARERSKQLLLTLYDKSVKPDHTSAISAPSIQASFYRTMLRTAARWGMPELAAKAGQRAFIASGHDHDQVKIMKWMRAAAPTLSQLPRPDVDGLKATTANPATRTEIARWRARRGTAHIPYIREDPRAPGYSVVRTTLHYYSPKVGGRKAR